MSPPIVRVVVADDEPLARERLRRMLRGEAGFQLVGEARNGPEAITLIRERQPHLALLDIHLPGLNAFAVLDELGPDTPPAVIFVTAFGNHALEAFQAGAVDYLLKPFELPRLREALRRAQHRSATQVWPRPVETVPRPASSSRISLRSNGRMVVVSLTEIEWVQAANNHCVVFTTDGPLRITESLGTLAARLPAGQFVRISRSALVNLAAIAAVRSKSHGDQTLELRSSSVVTVARTCRAEVLARLARQP